MNAAGLPLHPYTVDMTCECGGILVPTKLLSYDLSAYVGQNVPTISVDGYHCDKCHGETVDGYTLNVYMEGFNAGKAASPTRCRRDGRDIAKKKTK